MFAVEIFRYRAELACPRCSSTNVDRKFQYMGEFSCRHCDFFWRNP
jgi:ribosomal protein L37AE/L43A